MNPPINHSETVVAEATPIPRRNWTESGLGKVVASGMLFTEISPLNEIARIATIGLAIKYGDPLMTAAAAFGATMAIESGGAVVAADMLDTESGKRKVTAVNNRLEKLGVDKLFNTNPAMEAGVAVLAGSAVVTALKHREDPFRKRAQNRNYGLKSAAGISLMSSVQGLALAEGIHYPSPVTIGLGAVALGATVSGVRWAKNRIKRASRIEDTGINHVQAEHPLATRVTYEVPDSAESLQQSKEAYEVSVKNFHSPQKLGLSGNELTKALNNPDVIKAVYTDEKGKEVYLPFLVPIKDLYWYNHTYLAKRYGTGQLYYFAHATGALDADDPRAKCIKDITNQGGAIIYDTTHASDEFSGDLNALVSTDTVYNVDRLGDVDGNKSFLNQYEGIITFNGKRDAEFRSTGPIYDYYLKAIGDGKIKYDSQNGIALMDVIEDTNAEDIWEFYNKPFLQLSEDHPIGAGYDKEGFLELMRDSEVIKCVHRENDKITTLSLYVNNLKHCPWLSEEYYAARYPEAFQTDNLFISLGIVAREDSARTKTRSITMINFIMKLLALRETPVVFGFECNEVSAKYVPRIVQFAIDHGDSSHVEGLKEVQSQLNIFALRKSG